jgi:hypothetical protein
MRGAQPPTAPAGHPTTTPAASSAAPVDKAPNGHTIAEVFAARADLVGKPVTVRGRVVKFTGGVMNTNWMHLQDGSGSAGTGDHDITVTTHDEATIGDVVLVTGTVATNKDLGAGYTYDVLVEDAKISR